MSGAVGVALREGRARSRGSCDLSASWVWLRGCSAQFYDFLFQFLVPSDLSRFGEDPEWGYVFAISAQVRGGLPPAVHQPCERLCYLSFYSRFPGELPPGLSPRVVRGERCIFRFYNCKLVDDVLPEE